LDFAHASYSEHPLLQTDRRSWKYKPPIFKSEGRLLQPINGGDPAGYKFAWTVDPTFYNLAAIHGLVIHDICSADSGWTLHAR